MTPVFSSLCITGVAPTVCALLGEAPPEAAGAPLSPVLEKARDAFQGRTPGRILLYNPDAVALWLYLRYTERFSPVIRRTQLALPMLSVQPPVTPVCFASMYTGAQPEVHGIQTYEKPVLRIDTLWDALLRAGKHPAIVSTEGDSISCIFLEREMDYFLCKTPEECNETALRLIERDEYDVLLVYNGNYDETMHRHAPEGEESLAELDANMAAFARLSDAAEKHWAAHDAVTVFAPDHGCHEIDGGMGSHGLNMIEDMNITHFWGFQPKTNA